MAGTRITGFAKTYLQNMRVGGRAMGYEHNHISVDKDVMGGVPCITGTRVPVATILGHLANGVSQSDLVREYPRIDFEDIRAALDYAAFTLSKAAALKVAVWQK